MALNSYFSHLSALPWNVQRWYLKIICRIGKD